MTVHDKVNILMVDDQPGKLLSYEAILADLGENLDQGNLRQGCSRKTTEDRRRRRADGCEHARDRRL